MLRRQNCKKKQSAQTIVEYTMILVAVMLVLFAMNTMIKRGLQGMIKTVADQIGNQEDSEQEFINSGFLQESNTVLRIRTDKTRSEAVGVISYIYDDSTAMGSVAISNLGYTQEE